MSNDRAGGPNLAVIDVSAELSADLDLDQRFFTLSPASAEQITLQIRSMLERAWDYVAIAYQGRAYLALGYRTWDEYVEARLGDLRLTVPCEQRAAAVQAMSHARMSVRAIAKVLGVGVATVHRELAHHGEAPRKPQDRSDPALIQGRDGKTYPRRRRTLDTACSICGEIHDGEPGDCPWDLFAQGVGPRPACPEPTATDVPDHTDAGDLAISESTRPRLVDTDTSHIVDAVVRVSCLIDELGSLPQLVHEIEILDWTQLAAKQEPMLADRVRSLLDDLRAQSVVMPDLVERLERAANHLNAVDQDAIAGTRHAPNIFRQHSPHLAEPAPAAGNENLFQGTRLEPSP